ERKEDVVRAFEREQAVDVRGRHLARATGGDVETAGAVGGKLDVDGQSAAIWSRLRHEGHLRVGWGRAGRRPHPTRCYCSVTTKCRSVTNTTCSVADWPSTVAVQL